MVGKEITLVISLFSSPWNTMKLLVKSFVRREKCYGTKEVIILLLCIRGWKIHRTGARATQGRTKLRLTHTYTYRQFDIYKSSLHGPENICIIENLWLHRLGWQKSERTARRGWGMNRPGFLHFEYNPFCFSYSFSYFFSPVHCRDPVFPLPTIRIL